MAPTRRTFHYQERCGGGTVTGRAAAFNVLHVPCALLPLLLPGLATEAVVVSAVLSGPNGPLLVTSALLSARPQRSQGYAFTIMSRSTSNRKWSRRALWVSGAGRNGGGDGEALHARVRPQQVQHVLAHVLRGKKIISGYKVCRCCSRKTWSSHSMNLQPGLQIWRLVQLRFL